MPAAINKQGNQPHPAPPQIQGTTDNSNNSSVQETSPSVAITGAFPKSDLTDSIAIDSVNEAQTIRAEQQTDKGTLLMISGGREERGHLIVSSTLGQEGDQTFQSNYSIVFRQANKDKVLVGLPAYLFIRPTYRKLSFEKLRFKEADVYMLTPQYQTGHGVEGYIFAVDRHTGDAFSLGVVKKGLFSKTLLYSEAEPLPSPGKDGLVVHPPVGAGTPEEDAKELLYKLDWSKKQLVAE